ncbi:MAG: hypothetical protein J6S24_10430 [Lentisphaeria bacterium]|nr:hypothetical protein [Lentisphaeria bacterium]MBR2632043.1 hypothetical protein [Lentisphaeria bacterium]
MKKMSFLLLVGAMLLSVPAMANEDLINREAGVQNIKYQNGVISTMIVVGKAAVPRALRRNPGRAASYAGGKAQDDAQMQFVRFLSTKCKWGKTATGETAMKEASVSATDASGKETTADTSSFTETEMTKEQKEQAAQACISGLQVLCGGLDKSGRYTWVGAWNAKAAASIKGMAKTMNEAHAEVDDMGKAAKAKKAVEDAAERDAIRAKAANKGANKGAAPAAQESYNNTDILKGAQKPKSTVASDANDFL